MESVCGRAILHQVAPQERLPVEFFQVCPHGIWLNAFTPISLRRRAHRTQGTYRVRKSPCRRPQRCTYFQSSGHPRHHCNGGRNPCRANDFGAHDSDGGCLGTCEMVDWPAAKSYTRNRCKASAYDSEGRLHPPKHVSWLIGILQRHAHNRNAFPTSTPCNDAVWRPRGVPGGRACQAAPGIRMCNMQCDRHPPRATMLRQPRSDGCTRQASPACQRLSRSCRCSSRRRSLFRQGHHSMSGSVRVSQKHIPHICRTCPATRMVALTVGTLRPHREQSTCLFLATWKQKRPSSQQAALDLGSVWSVTAGGACV